MMKKNNRRIKKGLYFLGLTVLTLSFLTSCLGDFNTGLNNIENQIEIYSVSSSQHVLQDKGVASEYKMDGKYNVIAAQNEYENYQIVFEPEKDVKSYNFTVFDLVGSTGEKLPKEAFEVYHQKYQEVKQQSTVSTGIGWYPDALLPMEKAIEYDENNVKAGNQQGIWITVKTEKDTVPDTYTGTFKLTIDGKDYSIPASVTVMDYELTDNVTARSITNFDRYRLVYSGDNSLDTFKNYYDFLLKYRINGRQMPVVNPYDMNDVLESVVEYFDNPAFNTYQLPYSTQYNSTYGITEFNYTQLEECIRLFANYSIENGMDLLSKAVIYPGDFLDEADLYGTVEGTIKVTNDFEIFKNKIADSLVADETFVGENKEEILQSIRNIPCIITFVDGYKDAFWNDGEGVRYFCSEVHDFDSQEMRERYDELAEMGYEYYWYTCTGPHAPYPNWHLDTEVMASKVVRWMQKEYGVSGDLYWGVEWWNSEDPFDVFVCGGQNGDGVLLYPGSYYGMDTALSSIRLEAIRDGMEEYEMLSDINNIYAAYDSSIDADKGILKFLYNKLYKDAQYTVSSLEYDKVRLEMYQLATLAQSYDTYVLSYAQNQNSMKFEIAAKNDVTLKLDGQELTTSVANGEYKVYTINVALDKAVNILNLQATRGENTAKLNLDLGGKAIVLNALETENDLSCFHALNDKASLMLTDGNVFGDDRGGKALKVNVSANSDSYSGVYFTSSAFANLSNKTTSVLFDVYYDMGNVDTKLTVYFRFENSPVLVSVGEYNLKNGLTTIEVQNIGRLFTSTRGALKEIHIEVNKCDSDRTILFDNFVAKGGI